MKLKKAHVQLLARILVALAFFAVLVAISWFFGIEIGLLAGIALIIVR